MPGWLGIAVPWLLSLMVCTLLAGRTLSLLRLSFAVALSQIFFHVLFVIGFAASGSSSEMMTGHQHHHAAMALTGTTSAVHADAGMWVAHGIAAVVTVAVLHRGEHAVRRLLQIAAEFGAAVAASLGRVAVGAAAISTPDRTHPRLLPFSAFEALPPLGWHPSTLARRGPPVLFAP